MKAGGRTPRGPTAWRDAPRGEDGAMKPFPERGDFIAKLRASNRPTTKDLRRLRALKKTRPAPDGA